MDINYFTDEEISGVSKLFIGTEDDIALGFGILEVRIRSFTEYHHRAARQLYNLMYSGGDITHPVHCLPGRHFINIMYTEFLEFWHLIYQRNAH